MHRWGNKNESSWKNCWIIFSYCWWVRVNILNTRSCNGQICTSAMDVYSEFSYLGCLNIWLFPNDLCRTDAGSWFSSKDWDYQETLESQKHNIKKPFNSGTGMWLYYNSAPVQSIIPHGWTCSFHYRKSYFIIFVASSCGSILISFRYHIPKMNTKITEKREGS